MPCDYSRYPANWKEIRTKILERADHCCEGSPDYPDCRAANYEAHPETGSKVILTVAHLDHDTSNSAPSNLRAWCRRCHLNYDRKLHARNAAITRARKRGQLSLVREEVNGSY